MSEKQPTAEQQAAVLARGVSIALAAGAGCGKTTVLTRRFVSLLEGEQRLPLDRVVAMTFTEKAARELRGRVRKACLERVRSGDDPVHWRGIVRGLESARISTFHSFCGHAVRRFAVEAGVDPAFEVLDESVAPAIRERALDAATRTWLAERDPDFAAMAVDYGLMTIREALANSLANRTEVDLDLWAEREPEDVLEAWQRFRAVMPLDTLLSALAAKHHPTLTLIASEPCTHEKMRLRCLRLIDALPGLHLATNPIAELSSIREDAIVQGGGGKDAWPSEDVYKDVSKRFGKLRSDIDELRDFLGADIASSIEAARSAGQFARLLRQAIAAYERAKNDEGVLDFHDLQARLLNLLRSGDPKVLDELSGSIDALLVDEFQDTDPTQSEILDLLAGSAAHSGQLFLVGDAKQSIYGFRGARPAIFGTYRASFPDHGRLDLTENFRSVPAILNFVNALFGDTFPGAEHFLKPGRGVPPSHGRHVEFHWAGQPGFKVGAGADRRREADSIANLLRQRIDDGWTVRDGEDGWRRATPGDVAILFRTRGGFTDYEQSLTDAGFDYHVVGGTTYYSQQEVIDVLNVLAAVEDPLDALSLAGTLRGPLFGVSDEGLYWLAGGGTRDLVESFGNWERCGERLASDDRAAVERAFWALTRWRGRKDRIPIADLIGLALDESGYEAALMAEHLGPRKRLNVRKLVEIARKFDDRGSLGLGDFVAKLRADVINPPREDQAATADEGGNSVRLMTIHQAKGLEFPIVILPDIEHKSRHDTDLVIWHPDLGPLLRPRPEDGEEDVTPRNLAREIAAELNQAADRDEALRVFYVAATRAKDRLIVSNPSRPIAGPSSPPAAALLAGRFDLATGDCLAQLPVDGTRPVVGVIGPTGAREVESIGPKFRPKILSAARRILNAPPPSQGPAVVIAQRSDRFVLDATTHLAPTLREVDRLVRCAILRPSTEAIDVAARIEQAARTIGMIAPRRVRELAESRLEEWLEGPTSREIAVADTVVKDMRWTFAWPLGDVRGTVYVGRSDLAFRREDGTWALVGLTLDDTATSRAEMRLGLRLAAYAAYAQRFGPVRVATLVTLAGDSREERIEGFAESDIERAIAEVTIGLGGPFTA